MLTSAVSSTSAVVTGVAVAGVLIALLLFTTLILREYVFLSSPDTARYRKSFGAVTAVLGFVFLINLTIQTIAMI